MKLKNKVAIVTGCTSGIGRESAKLFAQEGAYVVVTGRNSERGQAVVDTIKSNGGEAIFVKADINVSVDMDMDMLISKTLEAYKKIDILFCNAGISITSSFEDFTEEKYNSVVDTNLKTPFQLSRKVLPYILEIKGNILYTSSVSSIRPSTLAYAYGASKSGLNSMMKALALDYAEKGVRFNSLCPGVTVTGILEGVPEETMEVLSAQIPMKRLAEPEEIEKAALFIVSDDAAYMTGQTLIIDGGYLL
jgi:NAD(P)-dependent dehydrogenase (short-subunit alcohol dehydrogenase family)